MPKPHQKIFQAIEITNSVLLAIVIIYLYDLTYHLAQPGLPLAILVFVPIKVILFSAFCGAITEISSGEELFFTLKSLKNNIRKLWWITLAVLAIPPAIYFLMLWLSNNTTPPAYNRFSIHFGTLISALLACAIIAQKYPKNKSTDSSSSPKTPITIEEIGIAILLYLASVIVASAPYVVQNPDWRLLNIADLVSIYLDLLAFVFFCLMIVERRPDITDRFTKGKEFIIINPLSTGLINSFIYSLARIHPAPIGILYAMTPKHYRIRVINHIVFRKRFFQPEKLVAITCYTPNSYEAYWIAKGYKARGSKVIMGGPHVSTLPDEALAFCDSVVIGEVESVWEDVIKDYEAGTLKDKYFGEPLENFSEKWHKQMLEIPLEVMKDSIESARGCKFDCDFCTSPYLAGRTIRKRPISEIVETIKKLKTKYRTIYFNDADIFADSVHAKELFRALIPLKIRWKSHCVLNIAKDEEALELAQKSGCFFLAIGLETNNPEVPKVQGGKFRMQYKYKEYVQNIRKRGIKVIPLFIYGFESDNILDAVKTLFFAMRMMTFRMTLSRLTPFPGTRLYYNLLKEHRLTNLNWRKYDLANFVFKRNKST